MASSVTVKIKRDDKLFTRLKNVLEKADGTNVKIGVLGTAAPRNDGLDNVSLAITHEYGTSTIHARPFIGPILSEKRRVYLELAKKLIAAQVKAEATVSDFERIFGLLGAKMAADGKKRITSGSGIPPSNSKETIRRKGSSRPLVDTGQLVNSITWLVGRDL